MAAFWHECSNAGAITSSKHPKKRDRRSTFVGNAIRRKQLIKAPVEVFWAVAFAPLYQLVKFHMHGKGFPGDRPFVLDDKTMQFTLDLVLKVLKH